MISLDERLEQKVNDRGRWRRAPSDPSKLTIMV